MISKFTEEAKTIFSIHTWVGLLVFVVFAQFIYNSFLWVYEHIIPDHRFYTYYGVYPTKTVYQTGELPRFVTDAEYYRSMSVKWQDILFCQLEGGVIDKMPTQFWPENGIDTELKLAGTKTLPVDAAAITSWPYAVAAVDATATECYLQWLVIGYSETGREITYSGRTEWFVVNSDI